LSHNKSIEAPETYEARRKLKQILRKEHYEIEEEVALPEVTNNMGEEIWPPYRADMILTKSFIIELDPQSPDKYKSKGHGTKKRRIHDQWRDKNIKNQINLKTVRLIPQEINQMSESKILEEIDWQLNEQQQ
jgi:hypothetical protein